MPRLMVTKDDTPRSCKSNSNLVEQLLTSVSVTGTVLVTVLTVWLIKLMRGRRDNNISRSRTNQSRANRNKNSHDRRGDDQKVDLALTLNCFAYTVFGIVQYGIVSYSYAFIEDIPTRLFYRLVGFICGGVGAAFIGPLYLIIGSMRRAFLRPFQRKK
ncbi:uncharacterized protein LOC142356459 [Convolutriloba macropyga]|uniref:uncharacterized protein LOC142356459 n=1 Tax=Convolutriloba macropyga TaxID=536237 RepID=UPI003F5278A2